MERKNTIKKRMKAIAETKQMACVMELSASSALYRAKQGLEESRLVSERSEEQSRWFGLKPFSTSGHGVTQVVVAGGERGLAGGYYARLFEAVLPDENVYAVGKKTTEFALSRRIPLVNRKPCRLDKCQCAADFLYEEFLKGRIETVSLIFPFPDGTVARKQLLPLKPTDETVCYDPCPSVVAERFVSFYLSAQIQYAAKQAAFCELLARREAMGKASENAEKMLERLTTTYHKARQSEVTGEMIEVLSGAEEW